MLTFNLRKAAFVELGQHISQIIDSQLLTPSKSCSDFLTTLNLAKAENQWFTEQEICFALNEWQKSLTNENLSQWLDQYDIKDEIEAKTIGVVMAGNIPLVGFHDFLSILLCGHQIIIKLSTNDKRLLPYLAHHLIQIEPKFKSKITFTEGKLEGYDAVIATGSNNTARYFEYYFRNVPNIIRKNRNGVAILQGTESKNDISNLGKDIYRYFGLGCRNVSKLYLPENYNFSLFYTGIQEFETILQHHKYSNNYDYNKAVYLMSNIHFKDNGFLILKKDSAISSPIGVVNFEYYSDDSHLEHLISSQKDNIQCIVGHHKIATFTFGNAQHPALSDYADGVDTVKFLMNL